jgi:N-carbamoylputrescine amidase
MMLPRRIIGLMRSDSVVTVALIQMRCSNDTKDNFERCVRAIEAAAELDANIVCTPELFRSSYFCKSVAHANFTLAEPIPGPTTRALSKIAMDRGIVIVAGIFERRAPGLYHDSAVVIDINGDLLGIYRKMHISEDRYNHEWFYFAEGDQGFRCFESARGKIGVLLGCDQWYPEAAYYRIGRCPSSS